MSFVHLVSVLPRLSITRESATSCSKLGYLLLGWVTCLVLVPATAPCPGPVVLELANFASTLIAPVLCLILVPVPRVNEKSKLSTASLCPRRLQAVATLARAPTRVTVVLSIWSPRRLTCTHLRGLIFSPRSNLVMSNIGAPLVECYVTSSLHRCIVQVSPRLSIRLSLQSANRLLRVATTGMIVGVKTSRM